MENGKSVSRKTRSVCDHSTRERTEARDRSGCLRSRSSQVPTGFTSRMAHSDETQKSKAEKLAKAAREPVPGRGPEATCGFLAETWWQDERRVALSELKAPADPGRPAPRAVPQGGGRRRPQARPGCSALQLSQATLGGALRVEKDQCQPGTQNPRDVMVTGRPDARSESERPPRRRRGVNH